MALTYGYVHEYFKIGFRQSVQISRCGGLVGVAIPYGNGIICVGQTRRNQLERVANSSVDIDAGIRPVGGRSPKKSATPVGLRNLRILYAKQITEI